MDLSSVGLKSFLNLNELEELRNDAYINSKILKERLKKWHDQLVFPQRFSKGQRVLLYDSKLHIFLGKLKSRWIGPFTIHQVHSNGVVELLNSNNTRGTSKQLDMSLKILGRGKTMKKKIHQGISHTLAKISQGMRNPSQISRTPRQRASYARVSRDFPPQEATTEAPQIPLSEGGAPTSPFSFAPQHKYETRRPATTQGATASHPQSSVRRPPAKRARISSPGESSRASQPESPVATHARAPAYYEFPSDMSPGSNIRCPMLTALPMRAT
ncbi:hypothetical protein CK203_025680 [Vitis vinifera]|uniref:Uncharacterized protein n=1 Tax=Vitis vinifera TaxID=29760 RepID=A0A438IGH1_VITVI|nr:hypothetical protein CK203_025680 [Vitis vinifera]